MSDYFYAALEARALDAEGHSGQLFAKTANAPSADVVKAIEGKMKLWSYSPLVTGAIGAVGGGLTGYHTGTQREGESDEAFQQRRMGRARVGGGLGMAAGGGLGALLALNRIKALDALPEYRAAFANEVLAAGRAAAAKAPGTAAAARAVVATKAPTTAAKTRAAATAKAPATAAKTREAVAAETVKVGSALYGGLGGGLIGAGVGYLGSTRRDDESDEEFADRRRRNALMGAGGGGVVGGLSGFGLSRIGKPLAEEVAAAPAAAAAATAAKKPSRLGRAAKGALGLGALAGGVDYMGGYDVTGSLPYGLAFGEG